MQDDVEAHNMTIYLAMWHDDIGVHDDMELVGNLIHVR